MYRQFANYVIVVIAMLLTVACSKPSQEQGGGSGIKQNSEEKKLHIVATTGMIGDLVRRIGGDRVQVDVMMGPGTDPHLYKAREKDIRMIAQADIVFYNGLHLEGKLAEVFERFTYREGKSLADQSRYKDIYAVTEEFQEEDLLASPKNPGAHDPHVWFNVKLWLKAALQINKRLIGKDNTIQEYIAPNMQKLTTELLELDKWTREQIASIPKEQRLLVTAHDAFGYFGKAYDIEVRGIQGISTESEASVNDLNQLIDFIVKRKAKAIFVESTISKKNVEALLEGAQAQMHPLKLGGELFSDAMGAEGTPEGTYVGMVRHNVNTIVNALK